MANAAIGLAANFPPTATVGQTAVPADLYFQNNSTNPSTLTITVTTISLLPSCSSYSFLACTGIDTGVFAISPTGTGRAGSACAAVAFTIAPSGAADGHYDITWPGTITLAAFGTAGLDECFIDFTIDVLKAPATDALPDVGHPGVQTLPSGIVQGTASDTSFALGFGTTFITVQPVQPTIVTLASGTVAVGNTISDQATLSGGVAATGSITFRAYGPADATCSNAPAFTSAPVTVAGNGTYTSAPFTVLLAGTYRWIASYSGDASNLPVAGLCNDANENVVVNKSNPAIVTVASGTTNAGSPITDTATLSLGVNPTGSITFNLYGPNDATCNTSIFTTSTSVSGNGSYLSASFAPLLVGTYRWIASYGGDANNNPVPGACNDSNETVTITQASPSIVTVASAGGGIGTNLTDQATLSGGAAPAGSITFVAYGPNDATCATPVFTSNAIVVSGNGSYTSTPVFTPGTAGLYRWRAFYSGDGNNAAVSGACNAANES
ncbi:MAG: hypothetical protein GZ089_08330, partial [Aromatoleum sp.]|nr:hypothetical protein [Aromatoleum sp.]